MLYTFTPSVPLIPSGTPYGSNLIITAPTSPTVLPVSKFNKYTPWVPLADIVVPQGIAQDGQVCCGNKTQSTCSLEITPSE